MKYKTEQELYYLCKNTYKIKTFIVKSILETDVTFFYSSSNYFIYNEETRTFTDTIFILHRDCFPTLEELVLCLNNKDYRYDKTNL
jgi:hypothetical protein